MFSNRSAMSTFLITVSSLSLLVVIALAMERFKLFFLLGSRFGFFLRAVKETEFHVC